jgi:hypothetical protein
MPKLFGNTKALNVLSLFGLERLHVVILLDEKYQYLKLLYIWRVSAALASSVSSRHHSVLRGCCDLLGWLKKANKCKRIWTEQKRTPEEESCMSLGSLFKSPKRKRRRESEEAVYKLSPNLEKKGKDREKILC